MGGTLLSLEALDGLAGAGRFDQVLARALRRFTLRRRLRGGTSGPPAERLDIAGHLAESCSARPSRGAGRDGLGTRGHLVADPRELAAERFLAQVGTGKLERGGVLDTLPVTEDGFEAELEGHGRLYPFVPAFAPKMACS
jgi:hypothetical protein